MVRESGLCSKTKSDAALEALDYVKMSLMLVCEGACDVRLHLAARPLGSRNEQPAALRPRTTSPHGRSLVIRCVQSGSSRL